MSARRADFAPVRDLVAVHTRALAERILADLPPEPDDVIGARRAVLANLDARPVPRPRPVPPPQLALVVTARTAIAVEGPPPGSATCVCRGSGWVCEDHPDVPYAIDPHFACPCDGAGARCPQCTPKEPTT
jgi:hypothetical protein